MPINSAFDQSARHDEADVVMERGTFVLDAKKK